MAPVNIALRESSGKKKNSWACFNFVYSLKGLRNNAQVSKGRIPVHLILACHFNSKKK